MLFTVINNPVISPDKLIYDLEVINHWAYQWKMEFNPEPNLGYCDIYHIPGLNSQNYMFGFIYAHRS